MAAEARNLSREMAHAYLTGIIRPQKHARSLPARAGRYAIRHTQYDIRNTLYAISYTLYTIRDTQYAIRNTAYAIRTKYAKQTQFTERPNERNLLFKKGLCQ